MTDRPDAMQQILRQGPLWRPITLASATQTPADSATSPFNTAPPLSVLQRQQTYVKFETHFTVLWLSILLASIAASQGTSVIVMGVPVQIGIISLLLLTVIAIFETILGCIVDRLSVQTMAILSPARAWGYALLFGGLLVHLLLEWWM